MRLDVVYPERALLLVHCRPTPRRPEQAAILLYLVLNDGTRLCSLAAFRGQVHLVVDFSAEPPCLVAPGLEVCVRRVEFDEVAPPFVRASSLRLSRNRSRGGVSTRRRSRMCWHTQNAATRVVSWSLTQDFIGILFVVHLRLSDTVAYSLRFVRHHTVSLEGKLGPISSRLGTRWSGMLGYCSEHSSEKMRRELVRGWVREWAGVFVSGWVKE